MSLGAAASVGLARCSSVTQQSFAATPVVLPTEPRETLALAETARNSMTVTRQGPSGNVSVEITNHASLYQRGQARGTPTLLEAFTGLVNGTAGAGAAVGATGAALGLDEPPAPGYAASPQAVDAAAVTAVLPAGARSDEGVALQDTLAMVPGAALDAQELTYDGAAPGAAIPGDRWFPNEIYFPDEAFPGTGVYDAYFPNDIYSPESGGPDDLRVVVPNAERLATRLGLDGLPEGTELIEPGQTIETAGTVFAGTGGTFFPDEIYDGYTYPPNPFYDHGVSLPLGGATFGLGVLATPDASVAGQSANPIVDTATTDLLQRDAIRAGPLARFVGGDSAFAVTWEAGPRQVDVASPTTTTTLLGTETTLERVLGVVSSDNGLFGLYLTVARTTGEDHVIAASAIRRPVSTVDGGMAAVEGSGWGMAPGLEGALKDGMLGRLEAFTGETIGQLTRAT